MKTLIIIFCFLVVNTSITFAASNNHQDVAVLSAKRDIFYFKVAPELIGARVDVYSASGKLLATSRISHRRAIIDFYFEDAGTYSIRITKDDLVLNFDYMKANPSPIKEGVFEHCVSITQH